MDTKRIAVIVRDRQSEAFRMSVGLTVLGDTIDIFVIRPVGGDNETTAQIEGVKELDMKVFTTVKGTDFGSITVEEMAEMVLEYDHILPY